MATQNIKINPAVTALLVLTLVAVIIYKFKDTIIAKVKSLLKNADASDTVKSQYTQAEAESTGITPLPSYTPSNTQSNTQSSSTMPAVKPGKLYPINIAAANLNLWLKKGSKGNEVAILQSILNKYVAYKGLAKLVVDGDFGSKTENALKKITGYTITISLKEALEVEKNLKP